MPTTYKGIRVKEDAYEAFHEFIVGLEMSLPPSKRLVLKVKASEALSELLNQPWAQEVRERGRRQAGLLL